MTQRGDPASTQDAINLANEAKDLATSIKQTYSTTNLFSKVVIVFVSLFLVLSIIYVNRYGEQLYYNIWSRIKGKWRIDES